VDPTTVAVYALIYVATMAGIVLLWLPILIAVVVLLLVAGGLQVVLFLLKVATAGLVRGVAGLFRSPSDRRPPPSHGRGLVPH
jgi:hypothetical protein